jgi:hypothetical protein
MSRCYFGKNNKEGNDMKGSKEHGMALMLLGITTLVKLSVIILLCVMPTHSKEIMHTLTEEKEELVHESHEKYEVKNNRQNHLIK